MSTIKSARRINTCLVITCLVGIALSYYAYTVEIKKHEDEDYEALCDINERVSCSKAFMSEYGKGFGIIPEDSIFYLPNPVFGLAYYTLVAVLSIYNGYKVALATVILGILSNVSSVYLAYILYLLNDICIVCVSTYIVNVCILTLAIKKFRSLSRNGTQKKKKKN